MNSKAKLVIIVFYSSLFIIQSCSHKTYPSMIRESALIIDGKINDWNTPLPLFDQESKINYEVSNDASNIYICMKIVDPQSQFKFLQNGFQLEIASKIDNGKKCSVEFPLADNFQQNFNIGNENGNPAIMDQKIKLLKANSIKSKVMMRLKGFSNLPEGEVSLASKTGISVATNFIDDDILIYEMALPIKNIIGRDPIANDTTFVFNVGFILKGKEMPEVTNDQSPSSSIQNGGGMPNRTAMPGGNAMPGGVGRGVDMSQMQKMFQEVRFSYKFKLALK